MDMALLSTPEKFAGSNDLRDCLCGDKIGAPVAAADVIGGRLQFWGADHLILIIPNSLA
jgi:hypothetical protein